MINLSKMLDRADPDWIAEVMRQAVRRAAHETAADCARRLIEAEDPRGEEELLRAIEHVKMAPHVGIKRDVARAWMNALRRVSEGMRPSAVAHHWMMLAACAWPHDWIAYIPPSDGLLGQYIERTSSPWWLAWDSAWRSVGWIKQQKPRGLTYWQSPAFSVMTACPREDGGMNTTSTNRVYVDCERKLYVEGRGLYILTYLPLPEVPTP